MIFKKEIQEIERKLINPITRKIGLGKIAKIGKRKRSKTKRSKRKRY